MNAKSKRKFADAARRLNEKYSMQRRALYTPEIGKRQAAWPLRAAVLALTVTACSTPVPPEPIVRTVTVDRPVPVSCVPAGLAAAPDYPDLDVKLRAAQDAAERFQLLTAGRLLRIARLAELEGVVSQCKVAAGNLTAPSPSP